MAVITPPYALQGGAINHDAILFRRVVQGLFTPDGEGVSRFNGLNDLKVSQNSPTGMSVLVARGGGYVKGDNATDQGFYFTYNDGNVTLTIGTSDLSNPRIDLVVAEIRDNFYGVSGDDWQFRVIAGTPAGSPTAPAVPSSAIALAEVRVNANATSVTDANITDRRARIAVQGATHIVTSTTRPASPWDGLTIYETDTDKLLIYDGTNWLLPDNVAGGFIARARKTSDTTSGLNTDPTDIPGLSVSVTVPAGRRMLLISNVLVGSSVDNDAAIVRHYRDTSQTSEGTHRSGRLMTGGNDIGVVWTSTDAPAAGTYTYKCTIGRSTGSGNIRVGNGSALFVLDTGVMV